MYNKVVLIGNMTRDPESRVVGEKNTAVSTFGLAVNSGYGQNKKTDFFDVECWGKAAENISAYGAKGKQILVEGRLKVDKWVDKNSGENRSKVVVVGETIRLVGSKKDAEEATTTSDVPDDSDIPF